MSAYIVDRHHIAYLAKIAAETNPHCRYWFPETRNLADADAIALGFANILAAENFRSVYHRYPDTDPTGPDAWKGAIDVPGDPDTMEPFSVSEIAAMEWDDKSNAQIAAALRSYTYQACESDDWTKTDAFRLTAALWEHVARELTKGATVSYEWGAPLPKGWTPKYAEPEPEPEPLAAQYEIVFDNAGGATLQNHNGSVVIHYNDMDQLARDVKELDGGDDPCAWDGIGPEGFISDDQYDHHARNGGYYAIQLDPEYRHNWPSPDDTGWNNIAAFIRAFHG